MVGDVRLLPPDPLSFGRSLGAIIARPAPPFHRLFTSADEKATLSHTPQSSMRIEVSKALNAFPSMS